MSYVGYAYSKFITGITSQYLPSTATYILVSKIVSLVSRMVRKPKIAIVGCGASGIAAATKLLENGYNDIIILEAENRIGGRVNSVDFGGSIVDLGAQWCHGEKDNVVFEMVKDLDLLSSSFNDYRDNTYYSSSGEIIDKYTTDQLFKIAMDIFDDEEGAKDFSGTFGEFFVQRYQTKVTETFGNDTNAHKIAKDMLDWFHKFFLCLDSAKTWYEMSAKGPFKYKLCDGNPQLHWKDKGYRTILYALMKKFPDVTQQIPIDDKIFFNKEVVKIVWDNNDINPNGVTIECRDGSMFNVDHVIVTVSLGVLKALHKTMFQPQLPAFKLNAIEAMSIGTVNKILLKFPAKWWPNDFKGLSLVWNEDDKRNVLNEFTEGPSKNGKSWLEDVFGFYVIDSHPSVLLGWVVGELAAEVELLSDEVVVDGCMYLLNKFAGSKYTIARPDAVLRSKWNSNPHFRGSYSYISLESEKRNASSEDLAAPLVSSESKQVLLFAGEATHPHYYSTVHGAMETGFREADRIMNIYK